MVLFLTEWLFFQRMSLCLAFVSFSTFVIITDAIFIKIKLFFSITLIFTCDPVILFFLIIYPHRTLINFISPHSTFTSAFTSASQLHFFILLIFLISIFIPVIFLAFIPLTFSFYQLHTYFHHLLSMQGHQQWQRVDHYFYFASMQEHQNLVHFEMDWFMFCSSTVIVVAMRYWWFIYSSSMMVLLLLLMSYSVDYQDCFSSTQVDLNQLFHYCLFTIYFSSREVISYPEEEID